MRGQDPGLPQETYSTGEMPPRREFRRAGTTERHFVDCHIVNCHFVFYL
jgi:hypothetical protein